uniref:Fe2OG dioxygenase domain-containing protein n=2 Tax=Strongyloides stercoralis TaxID=6248 RepID=A0AAF5D0W6_STRER
IIINIYFTMPSDIAMLKGLTIKKNYINDNEAKNLIKKIEDDLDDHSEVLKNRTVIHYGYKFNYSSNSAFQETIPIPMEFIEIIDKLKKDNLLLMDEIPDQVTVNIYEESQGIPYHTDTHSAFGRQIFSLSLLSDVVMQFKNCSNPNILINILLEKNSLLIMEDESLNANASLLSFMTSPNIATIPKEDDKGKLLESSYVQDVYENIADDFDRTRYSQWKSVSEFLTSLQPYSLVYDVGCGNGKYLIREDNLIKIGSDLCYNLCQIANNKGCQVLQADILKLPFLLESADAVISIAVIHHLSTYSRRQEAIRQIGKVLKVGGKGCITVWAMNQQGSRYELMRSKKSDEEISSSKKDDDSDILPVHSGKQFKQQDMLVPWKKKGEQQFLRYYHMFVENELESLINSVEGLKVQNCILEQGNWIATFEKIF